MTKPRILTSDSLQIHQEFLICEQLIHTLSAYRWNLTKPQTQPELRSRRILPRFCRQSTGPET